MNVTEVRVTTGLGWPIDWVSVSETVSEEARGSRSPHHERTGLGWPIDRSAGEGEPLPAGGASPVGTVPVDGWTSPEAAAEAEPSTPVSSDDMPLHNGDISVSRETEADARRPPVVDPRTPVVFTPTLPQPSQTRVFVVANQKGGVGKTTTAVNLAAALAGSGARVLLVDLDPQGNASTALGIDHGEGVPNIYDVVVEGEPLRNFVHPVDRFPSLYGVPATIDLSGAELELASVVAREARLKRALDAFLREQEAAGQRFDYVFIDCPPSLGLLTMNALVAGREVLVPIQCEYYALEGVETLFRIVDLVRELNRGLEVSTVILTMYDARTRLSAQVAENARENLGQTVLRCAIPRSVRISEAPSFGQTVMTWDPGSPGALSYLEAARELALRDPSHTPRPTHRADVPADLSRGEALGSATASGINRGDLS